MYFPTVLLSALSAGALALAFPNPLETTHPILRRNDLYDDQKPPGCICTHSTELDCTIAAYSDSNCAVLAGPVLRLEIGKCVQIGPTPSNHYMGISNPQYYAPAIQAFTDSKCNQSATFFPAVHNWLCPPKNTGQCFKQATHKGPWGSVVAVY